MSSDSPFEKRKKKRREAMRGSRTKMSYYDKVRIGDLVSHKDGAGEVFYGLVVSTADTVEWCPPSTDTLVKWNDEEEELWENCALLEVINEGR